MATLPNTPDEKFKFAAALHRAGRIVEAQTRYYEILRDTPHHVEVLHMSGIAAIQTQDFSGALERLDLALAIAPNLALAHHNRGVALENLGRTADAVASYDKALNLEPQHVDAWFNRGNALGVLGHLDDAIGSYDRAIVLAPQYAEAYYNRGNALRDLARLDEALVSYDQAIRFRPTLVEANADRAGLLMRIGRWDKALAALDDVLRLDPCNALAHTDRGTVLHKLGRSADAVASYERAAALQPANAEALNALGVAFSAVNRFKALACYEKALAVRPNYPEALNNRGNVFRELLRPAEALSDYDRAISLKPNYAEAYENLGLVLAELGKPGASTAALETAVRLAPHRTRVYYSLAGSKTFASGDPTIKAMAELLKALPSKDAAGRIHLHFALGKALADIGEPEASFRHFIAGNAIKRAEAPYDEAATILRLNRTSAAFSQRVMSVRREQGDASVQPVFIVGMPRCGSTLVEQILASHPQIHGAGEAVVFAQALAAFGDGAQAPLHSPEAASALDGAALRALGADYVRRIGENSPDTALRITDKFLENFRHIGLIHLAMPNARIVHVRRNPLDTCVSCFTKLFTGAVPYSYDLAELGRYYQAYERLMAHWRAVLPPGRLLDVQYEDLVDDLEAHARRIVTHCAIEWDPACLDFHVSQRHVRTASMLQVRQPVFKSSIGRWEPVQSHLAPLMDGLGITRSSTLPKRAS